MPITPVSSPGFHATVRGAGADAEVVFSGELDLASVAVAWRAVREALSPGIAGLTLDLRALEFMDAQGVHLLRALGDELHGAGIRLTLLPGPAARRVLRLTARTGRRERRSAYGSTSPRRIA